MELNTHPEARRIEVSRAIAENHLWEYRLEFSPFSERMSRPILQENHRLNNKIELDGWLNEEVQALVIEHNRSAGTVIGDYLFGLYLKMTRVYAAKVLEGARSHNGRMVLAEAFLDPLCRGQMQLFTHVRDLRNGIFVKGCSPLTIGEEKCLLIEINTRTLALTFPQPEHTQPVTRHAHLPLLVAGTVAKVA
jgi:hypothetical protein